MSKVIFSKVRFLFCLLLILLAGQVTAKASDAEAILILDASGSMWGQVENQTKIVAAKEAGKSIIATWPADIKLGLMPYGHRRKGDCADIEMLAKPGSTSAQDLSAMIDALQPRGKTPISQSLIDAAKTFSKENEDGSTVILVSDGIETCNADPCAVAEQLKRGDVKFITHVIGFDITDPKARAQLSCIADKTGGLYFDASNAAGLTDAMGKAAKAVQGEKVAASKPVEEPKKAETNVAITLRLSEDSDPLTTGETVWSFYLKGEGATLEEQYNNGTLGDSTVRQYAGLEYKLPPGSYVVRVIYGELLRFFPLEVPKDKPVEADFVLDGGFVTSVGSISGTENMDKEEDLEWRVYTAAKPDVLDDVELGDNTAFKGRTAVPTFALPVGEYVMVMIRGKAETSKRFSIAAGDSINVEMKLDVGTINANVVLVEGGPNIDFNIDFGVFLAPDPGSKEQTGEPAGAGTTRPDARFDLPSGNYVLKISTAMVKRYFPFKIESGQDATQVFNMNAGFVAWKGPDDLAEVEWFDGAAWAKEDEQKLGSYYEQSDDRLLPAGDIMLVARFKDGTKKQFPLKVEAGKTLEVVIAK